MPPNYPLHQPENKTLQQWSISSINCPTDLEVDVNKGTNGDDMAQLAIGVFVDRVVGYIVNYLVKLGGRG